MAKKYSKEDLINAIDEVRNGAKIRETERKYNIPHATLMDKLKEKSSLDARKGPQTILTREEENLLVLWLKAMAKKGMPVEPRQLLDSVEEIIKKDGRPSPFTEGRPGRKWLDLFFKRHPDVSLRKPEALGVARSFVTEHAIREWHDNLHKYIIDETGNYNLLKDPFRIINGDESGFQTNPVTSLVIGPKGLKDLYEVRGSDKECITVMVTFTASGKMAPPCIVYPYERIPAEISRNVNPEWSLGRSKSGWMTAQVFFGYVANNLLPFLKENNTTFPVLYLVDGHRSHISFEVAMFCMKNDIILYSFLPNATHILQPADVSVFRPIKVSWKKTVSDWLKRTGARSVTRANFAPLIENALQAANEDVLKNGFRKCGIYPFDKESIDYTKCLSHVSRVIDKPCHFKTEHLLFLESMFPSSRVNQFRSSGEQWSGDEPAKELFDVWKKIKTHILSQDKTASFSLASDSPIPTTSYNPETSSCIQPSVIYHEEPIETGQQPTQTNNLQRQEENISKVSGEPEMPCISPTVGRTIKMGVSPAFADCVFWPTQSPVKKDKKGRKKIKLPDAIGAGAWVEYWKNKEEEKIKKEEKIIERLEKKKEKEELKKLAEGQGKSIKKEMKKKRKQKEDFSSSEEDNLLMEIEENSLDDLDMSDLLQSRTPTPNMDELLKDPEEGDFALLKFPLENGESEAYYIGQILKMKENQEIEVSCLRKSVKCTNKFVFPIVPDITVIGKDQIVHTLKSTIVRGTKRQQSAVTFEINLKNFNVR